MWQYKGGERRHDYLVTCHGWDHLQDPLKGERQVGRQVGEKGSLSWCKISHNVVREAKIETQTPNPTLRLVSCLEPGGGLSAMSSMMREGAKIGKFN